MLKIFYSFYNIVFITIYYLTLPFVFILVKLKYLSQDFLEYYGFTDLKELHNKSIWFHCASIGELKSITELINIIKKEFPYLNIVVTTVTIDGKKMAQKEIKGSINFLLPIENTKAIQKIIHKCDVKLLFIVETELWPNLINCASQYCKLFLINARMTQSSFKKYKLLSFIFKDLLHKFCRIYTKSAYDKNLIEKIYEKKLEYTGNTKFNNLEVKVDKDIIDTFKNKKCLLLASTHNGEESFFIKYAYKYIDKFDYVIIAPRHINRIGKIEQLLKKYNYPVAVFSINKNFKKFIIIDVYGLMDSFYAISSKIFVGGSLVNVGGHNIYEALRLKKFIAVGPFMNNFIDIYELALFYGLIHTINNIDDFLNYLNNNERKEELFNYFFSELENKNKKTLNHILSTIKNEIK